MNILYKSHPFLSHTLSRFKKKEFVIVSFTEPKTSKPETSNSVKMVIPFLLKSATDSGLIDELTHLLFTSGYDVYLFHEKKHKIYRLFDNPFTFGELMDGETKGSLVGIPKDQSLFVAYFSHMSSMSGAELSMFNQIDDLRYTGVLSHVVTPQRGLLTEKLRRRGIPYDVVSYHWWGNTSKPTALQMSLSLKEVSAYREELVKINPHVIYTNTLCIPWGAYSALLLHKPHVWHIKEFGIKDHGFQFIFDVSEIKKIIGQTSNLILFNSHAVEKEFLYGTPNSVLTKTLYYNVRIDKKRRKETIPDIFKIPNSFRLILVGNVYPAKGQMEALKAVAELNKRSISVELAVVGQLNTDSAFYKELVAYKKQNDLTNVYFYGYTPHPHAYMRQADAVLVCSQYEAFGKVTVEAMLLGKCVIGANTGGTKEIIQEGKNGFLYKQGSPLDLAQKILRIVKDRDLHRKVGTSASAYALKHFTNNSYPELLMKYLLNLKNTKQIPKEPFVEYVSKLFAVSFQTSSPKPTRLQKVLTRLRVYERQLN